MAFEAGGKVAQSTVEALKGQPVALSLVIVNVVFLFAGGWAFHELSENSRQNREAIYKLMHHMVDCRQPQ